MPVRVDHDARRADLARAVWRTVIRDGVGAASVRGVAREAGLSMGSVRHFFASQDELLRFAVEELVDQASRRIAAAMPARMAALDEGRPLEAVASLLAEVLPLGDERLTEARVWAAFTAAPAANPDIAAIRRQADEGIGELCGQALSALAEFDLLHPARDVGIESERIHALLDGLTIHLVLDPANTPAARVSTVLHVHLGDLRSAPAD